MLIVVLAAGGPLVACSGDDSPPPADAGSAPRDAGSNDAGEAMDAAGTDAGTGLDAGASDVDAGTGVDAGSAATDAGPMSGCAGGCATGFTCTSAGYCATATGVPAFGHVYVIVMENRSRTSVAGAAAAPYLNGLMTSYATATAYYSVQHPSLPNYLAMVSGDHWGVGCDCHPAGMSACTALTCNIVLSGCSCNQAHTHLGDQLDTAGIAWREYAEGMGTPCNAVDNGGRHYAAKHVPFLYFDNVFSDMTRCTARVRDYRDFAADLTAGTYRFSYIAPDLCNDMHDACGGDAVGNGDMWSMTNVPPILATPGFAAGGTDVLFIVWDEEDFSIGHSPLPFIVVSPLVRAGASTAAMINHYSLLATWQDGLGVPRLGMSTAATPITDIWR